MSRPLLRIAAAQYGVSFLGSWDAYREKLGSWVADGAAAGAELLVFPEYGAMELASLFPESVHSRLDRQLDALQELLPDYLSLHRDLAKRHDVHVLAASLPVRLADGSYRNRAYLIAPDGGSAFQEKRIMTRFEAERWGIAPGDGLRVFDTALGRIGVAICYDIEFPLAVRAQCEAGAELILAPSCTDTPAGHHRVRVGAQARALENQCHVVVAPTVGECPWTPAIDVNVGAAGAYAPADMLYAETGVVAEGPLNETRWVFADLDLAALEAVRRDGQVLNDRDWARQPGTRAVPVEVVPLGAAPSGSKEIC